MQPYLRPQLTSPPLQRHLPPLLPSAPRAHHHNDSYYNNSHLHPSEKPDKDRQRDSRSAEPAQRGLRLIEHQRSSQSPTTANSPSLTPEPSRPISPSSTVSSANNTNSKRSPSIIPPHTSSTKRRRSPSPPPSSATTQSDYAPTSTKLPRIMSARFAQAPSSQPQQSSGDVWNPHMQQHQDRVVLPPLSSAVDNGLTPSSRRTSMASPSYTANTPTGSYNYSNTFESQRPPTASSVASPVMNNVRMDMSSTPDAGSNHGVHPYRRPHMASRSQSAIVGRAGGPGSIVTSPTDMGAPRMASYNSEPAMSWNIPPPSHPSSAGGQDSSHRSHHHHQNSHGGGYGPYGDYATQDFNGNLTTTGDGTPQSPSFAFTSSGFTPPGQQSAMFASLTNNPQRQSSYSLQSGNGGPGCQTTPPASTSSSTTLMDTSQAHTPTPIEEELSQLRTKVRELEFVNDLVQLRVVELENERTKLLNNGVGDSSKSEGGPSPTRNLNTPPLSDDFQQSWEQRTEARIKRFCSLNRAGNALCAWHDSRRERRAYPPRMAPPGTLNCGCTFEEALFEESLSRHRVGSYLPGETVRMDPALRNPLLKLMQWRYNYKDGDFERDPMTGRWVEGEGEQVWQQKASSGTGSRRKQSDSDSV
ncbi:hypothetical protein FRB96_000823 [Tulasnella sp. 330]|nr:hypothetical protein FRB96_000823 [Tulasnella sp. 330]KAG8881931.1 hypothetical protein FRB97_008889 [Tulasnella sp. 331]KAG8887943.1 hypothetical protein FRB98_008701 [Tulasnella sp. 332]